MVCWCSALRLLLVLTCVLSAGGIPATAWTEEEKPIMQIEFIQEGGLAYFPGLSQPFKIDGAQLSEAEAAELRRLIDEAEFFKLPRKIDTPPRGAADYYQYTITVEDSGHRHAVHFTEFADNSALKRLLAFLKSLRAAQINKS